MTLSSRLPKFYKAENKTYFFVGLAVLTCLVLLQFVILYQKDVFSLGNDEWVIIQDVELAFKGEVNWERLWRPHGGHHIFGYKILFILNALFLDLNVQYFQFGGAVLWALACLFSFAYIGKRFSFSGPFAQSLAAIIIVTTFLSPHAWHLQDNSLTSWRLGNILGFVLIFICLDRIIHAAHEVKRLKTFLGISALMVVYSLIFGRGWGQAMLLTCTAIAGAYSLYFGYQKKWMNVRWLAAVITMCWVCMVIYRMGGYELQAKNSGTFSLLGLVNFAIHLLGNSVAHLALGHHSRNPENLIYIRILGYLVITLYIWAFAIFLKARTYKHTTFPVALMVYSAVAVLAVYYGRGMSLGWKGALAGRYVGGETCLGLAGALALIVSYYWQSGVMALRKLGTPIRGVVTIIIAGLLSFHVIAMISVFDRISHVRAADDKKMETLFAHPVESFRDNNLAMAASCRHYNRCKRRYVLEEHNLVPRD